MKFRRDPFTLPACMHRVRFTTGLVSMRVFVFDWKVVGFV